MQVFVKTEKDKIIALTVEPTDTVQIVKYKFQAKEGIPIHNQQLMYAARFLQDGYTLNHYNIKEESILYVIIYHGPKQKPIQISVNILAQETILLDVEMTDTIRNIKNKIQYKTGISSCKQQLMSPHTILIDDMALQDYSVHNEWNLYLFQTDTAKTEEKTINSIPLQITDNGTKCVVCDAKNQYNDIFWRYCNGTLCNHCFEFIKEPQMHSNYQSYRNCEISSCYRLQRFVMVMNKYNTSKLNEYSGNISWILDDYLHLLHKHSDDEGFEKIFNELQRCDVTKCECFSRNNRDRSRVQSCQEVEQKMDKHNIIYLQIMDKMHCCFQHSFDIGNRITIQQKKSIDIDHKNVDQKWLKINKMLCSNRARFESISGKNINRTNTKYTQLFSDTKQEIKRDSDVTSVNNSMYRIGFQFKYGIIDENVSHSDEIEDGYYNLNQAITTAPKFSCLKEELTKNQITLVTIEQFNVEYAKAIIHVNSRYCRWHYRNMCSEHILALMIYCNCDDLQYEFSKTYRENSGLNHNNYYYLGKNLKIAVHGFGKEVRRHGCCGRTDPPNLRFYHGVRGLLSFSSYGIEQNELQTAKQYAGIRIHCPLSTTSSFAVAMNFATQGLIVEFADNDSKKLSCKYFSTSWISDYPNEQEHLFVQNIYKLQIANIINVHCGDEYITILNSLKIISNFSVRYHECEKHADAQLLTELTNALIENQLCKKIKTYKVFNSLSKYAQIMCDTYFNNTKQVTIRYLQWTQLGFWPDGRLQISLLNTLFPKLQKITIDCGYSVCLKLMEDILSYFDSKSSKSKFEVHIQSYGGYRNLNKPIHTFSEAFSKRNILIFGSMSRNYSEQILATHIVTIFIYRGVISDVQFAFKLIDQMDIIKFEDTTNKMTNLISEFLKNKLFGINNNNHQLLFDKFSDSKLCVLIDYSKIQTVKHFMGFKVFFTTKQYCLDLKKLQIVFPNATHITILKVNSRDSTLDHYSKYFSENDTNLKIIELLFTNMGDFQFIHRFRKKYESLRYTRQGTRHGQCVFITKHKNSVSIPYDYDANGHFRLHQ